MLKLQIKRAISLILFVMFLAVFVRPGLADVPDSTVIEVPIAINIIGSTDASKVEAAIKKANEILKAAGVKLVPVITYQPVNVGDNDPNLTSDEGDTAMTDGEKEVKRLWGAGKGAKLTIANNVWTEKPNTVGWAIHKRNVVFVEPDNDANKMGRVVAHEFAHAFTINYDIYDSNDPNNRNRLMWGYNNGGSVITPAERKEIRKGAAPRAFNAFVNPVFLAPGLVVTSGVTDYLTSHGAYLDDLGDLMIDPPPMDWEFEGFECVDLHSASAFCAGPGQSLIFSLQPNGMFPVDSFFDVTYHIEMDKDGDLSMPEAMMDVHITPGGSDIPFVEVAFFDPVGAPPEFLPPDLIDVLLNFKFPDFNQPAIPDNHSIDVNIPPEFFGPGGDPFNGTISFKVTAMGQITGPDGVMHQVTDENDEWFIYQPQQVSPCPSLKFTARAMEPDMGGETIYTVLGCGFTEPAEVMLNGDRIGIAESDPIEGLRFDIMPGMITEPGVQEVTVIDMGLSGNWTTGYFSTTPPVEGDIDSDSDVDFEDFARLANNWLVGK